MWCGAKATAVHGSVMFRKTHGDDEESLSRKRALKQGKPLIAMQTLLDQHLLCGFGCARFLGYYKHNGLIINALYFSLHVPVVQKKHIAI